MLKLAAIVAGVGLVSIEILIQIFNDGECSRFACWLSGLYIGLGCICLSQGDTLEGVLCFLPTLTILISNWIRKSGQRVEGSNPYVA